MRSVHVDDLLARGRETLGLRPLAGLAGLGRTVSSWKALRPGRTLGRQGFTLGANRTVIVGRAEMETLEALPPERRRYVLTQLAGLDVPCVILEGSLPCTEDLISFSEGQAVPLLATSLSGVRLSRGLVKLLRELLGPPFHIQGVLLRVFQLGVLIVGRSGIGKSECALDLIDRGHALVADDFVELSLDAQGRVVGRSPQLLRNHIEVRGLGILNVMDLFGPEAVEESHAIDLVVELLEWEQFRDEDRSGLTRRRFTLLDRDLPLLRIPVSLNRNIAILLEVAVRNHLLASSGASPLRSLDRKIQRGLLGGVAP